MAEIEKTPSVVAPPSGSCGEVEGRDQGASPSGSGSQASPGNPAGCRPEGFDPSRLGSSDKVVIWSKRLQEYWLEPFKGSTEDLRSAHVFTRAQALKLIDGFAGDRSRFELRAPWSPAQAMEARQGGDAEGGSVVDDSAVTEGDVPASLSQSPPTPPGDLIQVAREEDHDIHFAVVEILDWMMCEGMMRYRSPENDGEQIEKIIRSALHRQEKVEDRPEGSGETFETIAQWCEETFGPIEPARIVGRAAEEMEELRAEPEKVEEAADVVIVLSRYPGLWAAVERKMAVNRARKWRLMGDGTGYHVKDASRTTSASTKGQSDE